MMRKCYYFGIILSLVLLLTLAGCGGGNSGGNDDGPGGGGVKTADPYPSQSVTDINPEKWSNRTFQPYNDKDAFKNYLLDITGFSDDGSNCPESARSILTNVISYMYNSLPAGYGHLLVSVCEYKMVSNALFFEYTNWYQPNSTLSVTLSNINETSVTNSLTTSVGVSLGYDASGFNASISKESSKTVTTAKGIEVATTYDLTQYDQSKQYKVVLAGNYAYVRYHFRVEGATASLPTQWNTDESSYGYIGYIEAIKVYQDTLAVKLVHN